MADPQTRDAIRAHYQQQTDALAVQLAAGVITLAAWQDGMKAALRESYALQLRAGSDAPLSASDYARINEPLVTQYRYLSSFAGEIASGAVENEAVAARAALYVASAVQMYWKALTHFVELPDYPPEHPNCECEWQDNGDGTYTWLLGANDNHCPVCLDYAARWNPYTP